MINLEDFFYEIGETPRFTNMLYENLNKALDDNTFHISGNNLLRIDLDDILIENIRQEYEKIPISDISIFKNDPGFRYNIHRDRIRKCAINILLSAPDDDMEVVFYSDNFSNKFPIPYRKDIPMLINTQQYHSIKNNSQCKFRYVLSLGCTKLDYFTVKTLLTDK